nr:MAG TPA: hypothetical protein [Crassvirales sp.]
MHSLLGFLDLFIILNMKVAHYTVKNVVIIFHLTI